MKHPHWHYFAALADDVEKTVRFVEPTPDNFKAYSVEFARLYLAIGSEIDVVAKLLCKAVNPSTKPGGINTYRPVILTGFPQVPDVELTATRNEISLVPWKDWNSGINPSWWSCYNDVKHERDKHFKDANLENTLNALAGLMVLTGYLYAEDLRDNLVPITSAGFIRFSQKYFSGTGMGPRGFVMSYRLPGIQQSPALLAALKRTRGH
jgi:hypothetical protein